MNNDRPITIVTAGNRNSTDWKQWDTTAWGVIAKLGMPQRGPETLADYLAKPKAEQDTLKDVGGYVAGTLSGTRRKANAVISRCAVTLDADNIPAHGASDFLRKVDGLNCLFAAHSTRKHSPLTPRLRLFLPTNRDMLSDEYEPVSRWVAARIGMEYFDPTTFEASRLMYWPSLCADSEWIYYYVDHLFLNVDGVLATYADWHDMRQWPVALGEQKRVDANLARAKRQQDPESKSGAIGTFCRLYSIPQVMTKLIPGIYDQCDDNRYTFTGGSTAGGAVLYDDGKFLFSHHATDPASGKLLNAFDLLRIHRFGELDDASPPNAFGNQLPSFKAALAFIENLPDVKRQMEEERGAEVLEDFGGDIAQQVQNDPDRKAAIGRLQDGIFTTDLLKQPILPVLGINTKLNIISNEAEITGAPATWSRENAVNLLPTLIRDFCKKAEVRGVSKDAIMDSLALINDEQRFNPVLDRLYSVRWDGVDRLPTIYAILGQTEALPQKLIRKWLHQCVAMAHNDTSRPYGADGVLTLTGAGGIGKTSFFHWLAMDPHWFAEGIRLDPNNKDKTIEALRVWIAELGELDGTLRRDIPWLKGFLTQSIDNIRAPYARSATNRPRRTSFCGTVNQDDFLRDETGNRRFWTVPVKSIDLDLMNRLNAAWLHQLWAQTLAIHTANPQGFRLTRAERIALEAVNDKHMVALPYEDEVRDRLDFSLPTSDWVIASASQIARLLSPPPDSRHIGRVLAKIARSDERVRLDKRVHSLRVFALPVKNGANIFSTQ